MVGPEKAHLNAAALAIEVERMHTTEYHLLLAARFSIRMKNLQANTSAFSDATSHQDKRRGQGQSVEIQRCVAIRMVLAFLPTSRQSKASNPQLHNDPSIVIIRLDLVHRPNNLLLELNPVQIPIPNEVLFVLQQPANKAEHHQAKHQKLHSEPSPERLKITDDGLLALPMLVYSVSEMDYLHEERPEGVKHECHAEGDEDVDFGHVARAWR